MITKVTSPALSAHTLERIDLVDAGAAIQTWTSSTVVDVLVAVKAGVTRVAGAPSSAASSASSAGSTFAPAAKVVIGNANVRVVGCGLGAVFSLPSLGTVAVVIRLSVVAGCRVPAGVRAAMVAVDFTLVSGVADGTYALVGVYQVAAFTAVLAGLRCTIVDVDVAVFPGVPWGARAVVVVYEIDAKGPVLALSNAIVYISGAVFSREPTTTSASIVTG